MLVDCFTFFNELDMLECRLAYLQEKVDLFVLVEADITHSGKSKPFYFEQNKDRYQKYLNKILHIKISIDPNEYDWLYRKELGFKNASWQVENRQRNAILQGLEQLPNDAIVMISDLDEIPELSAIDRALNLLKQKNILAFETGQFLYNLGQRLVEPWPATVITRKDLAKSITPQKLRDSKNSLPRILKGGWHLTYFADIEQIQTKIANFAHQEYNNSQFTDNNYIQQQMQNGQDLYGRQFPMQQINKESFPKRFQEVFAKYFPRQTLNHYAETIDGFFAVEDFEFYKRVVANSKGTSHFVEVGSYKGRSSAFMAVEIALSGKSIQFDCVDTWEGSEEHQQGNNFEDSDVVNGRLFDVFSANMKPVEKYYRPIRGTSISIARRYSDQSLDLVFIDAAHDYESVREDILAWAPKIKPGGIISGHDWHHQPIKQAVTEVLGQISTIGNCWYTFKE